MRLPTIFKKRLVPLAILGIVFSLVSFYLLVNFVSRSNEEKRELEKLESLVKKVPVYLDEQLFDGASFDSKIYSVLKTDVGEYALVQIANAKVNGSKFMGDVTLRLPNGELYQGSTGAFLPEIILRDGTKLPAQVVENAIAVLRLSDGRFVPIELTLAEIIESRIIKSIGKMVFLFIIFRLTKFTIKIIPLLFRPRQCCAASHPREIARGNHAQSSCCGGPAPQAPARTRVDSA